MSALDWDDLHHFHICSQFAEFNINNENKETWIMKFYTFVIFWWFKNQYSFIIAKS